MIILLTELKYMQNYFIPFNPMQLSQHVTIMYNRGINKY